MVQARQLTSQARGRARLLRQSKTARSVCFAPFPACVMKQRAMTTEYSLPTMKLTPHSVIEQIQLHGWNWRSSGAACGLCFGLISPLAGSVLTAIVWFTGSHWHGFFLQRCGTVLLFLTIPLLIFGAHCLDLMDKENERAKSRRHRVAGLQK